MMKSRRRRAINPGSGCAFGSSLRRMRRRTCLGVALCLFGLALGSLVGCSSGKSGTQTTDARGRDITLANALSGHPKHMLDGGRPDLEIARIQQLDVYQLTVPLGAVSRSEEFWKLTPSRFSHRS